MKRELDSLKMDFPFETFTDILGLIGRQCDIFTLTNFSSTCKAIHEVCAKESFYRDYFKSYYMPESLNKKNLKDVCLALVRSL
jgi:hypothetical protein